VDDDEVIRKLLARQLVAVGHVVRTAENGLEGIAKLRTGLPGLIISDLNMPGMNGIEFLGVVRKRFPQIPVIAIGSISEGELPEGLAADAFCSKNGLGFKEILATVAELAGKPSQRPPAPPPGHDPVLARWNGNGHYILSCDDCLRDFTVPRVFHLTQNEKSATCVHCGKTLPFLVVASAEGNSSRVSVGSANESKGAEAKTGAEECYDLTLERPVATSLECRAAQIGGAQHALLLDCGFTVAEVGEDTTVYQCQLDSRQITLDAVGRWCIESEDQRAIFGIGVVDLEAALSPDGR